jgi:hypothetical protein
VELVSYDAASEQLSPEMREVLLRAASRAGLTEGDPLYSVLIAQSEILDEKLSAFLTELSSRPAAGSNGSREMLDTRNELNALKRSLAQLADGVKKIEGKFGVFNDAVDVFTTVKRHQLWWLLTTAFCFGVLALPVLGVLIDWIRGTLHG